MLLSGPCTVGRLVRVRSRAPNAAVDTYGSFAHIDFTGGNVAASLVPFNHQDLVKVTVLKVGGRKGEGVGLCSLGNQRATPYWWRDSQNPATSKWWLPLICTEEWI